MPQPPVHRHLVAMAVAAIALSATPLAAQTDWRPIDRWLVSTSITRTNGANPLDTDGQRLFPDRDVTLGPGYWTLVREDGRSTFALAEITSGQRPGATLAHAYIKAPSDLTVSVEIETPECAQPTAWLNGQGVSGDGGRSRVRLAGGWNTLLVALDRVDDCSPDLGVRLSSGHGPRRDDEDPVDLQSLIVQASRPPGARPNYPEGVLQLDAPYPVDLLWQAGSDQLLANVSYTVTAWGAPAGTRLFDTDDEDLPTEPPTIDLTGEWMVTLYTPTGILTSHVALAMAADGELTGRMDGERLEGEIKEGWVSRDEFGWKIRFPGRGRDLEVSMRGILTDDEMTGTLDFGGFRDFEARFEGTRMAATDDNGEGTEGDEEQNEADATPERDEPEPTARREPPADLPQIPAPGDRDPAERQRDELASPADPDGQRASIVRQLLPPPRELPDAAPTDATIRLGIAGREITGSFDQLEPARPASRSGQVEWRRVRTASLNEVGVEARVRWHGDNYDFSGRMSAGELLEALHRPIALGGWGLAGADGFAGAFRVPQAFDGFTLRAGDGVWTVDGVAASDDTVCGPCKAGRTYDLTVSGTESPVVQIVEEGYPSSGAGPDVPPAEAWLEALRGDNEGYRALARRFGETGGGS